MENPYKQKSKINPQRENGHRQIANDIWTAIARAGLSGAERSVLDCIMNYSWGYDKESITLPIPQIVLYCKNYCEQTIHNAILKLKEKHILIGVQNIVQGTKNCTHMGTESCTPSKLTKKYKYALNEFMFNKHYDTWTMFGTQKDIEDIVKIAGVQNIVQGTKNFKKIVPPTILKKYKEIDIIKKIYNDNFNEAYFLRLIKQTKTKLTKKKWISLKLPNDEIKKLQDWIELMKITPKNAGGWADQDIQYLPNPLAILEDKLWQKQYIKREVNCGRQNQVKPSDDKLSAYDQLPTISTDDE